MFIKAIHPQKANLSGSLHSRKVLESQVVTHQFDNPLRITDGKPELFADIFGHFGAHLDVIVKADTLPHNKSARFADIVQQYTKCHCGRRVFKPIQHQQGVCPHVAFRVELRRLLNSLQGLHLGQHLLQQVGAVQQFEAPARLSLRQDFQDFVANSFSADQPDFDGQFSDGVCSLGVKLKVQPRGKTHGAKHAKAVLAEAFVRVANGADSATANVRLPSNVIEHRVFYRIVEQTVNGKVT